MQDERPEMIYRIVVARPGVPGAGSVLGDLMRELGLEPPDLDAPKGPLAFGIRWYPFRYRKKGVTFWFTERGWREIGRHVVAEAQKQGVKVRVLKRKNPPRSEVVYKDEWQVALLPHRKGMYR